MRAITFNDKIVEILVLLIPFLLITGPFLSDLSLILSCLIIVLIKKKSLVDTIIKNKLLKLIFIFYIYLVFCSFIIPLKENYFVQSFRSSFFYIRFLIFLIAELISFAILVKSVFLVFSPKLILIEESIILFSIFNAVST